VSCALVAAAIVGTSGTLSAQAAASHSTLNVGLEESVYTLNPELSTELDDRYVMYAIYDNLFMLNTHYDVVPDLVTSWSTPSPDTYIFHLRPNVKFSNGDPFNASVVKWNLDNELNPKTLSPEAAYLAAIKSIKVVNATTVQLTLKNPSPDLPAILTDRAGMMIDPTAFEKCPAGKYGVQGGCAPVGTGPYMLSSWSTPDTIVLVPNPYYYARSDVHFKQVVFHVIPDATTRVTELRNGELDVIDELSADDVAPLKGDTSVVIDTFKTLDWMEAAFNLKVKPFNLLDVRKAFAYAINRSEVLKVAYSGLGSANPHYITGGWAYDPSLKTYPYDPAKAMSLLKAAGLPNGFTFDLYATSGDTPDDLAAEVIQSNLAAIHVKAVIKYLDGAALYADDLAEKLDFSIGDWTPRPDPGYMLELHYEYGSTQDYYPFDNAQVNKLIIAANTTYDQATRKQDLDKAEDILEQQLPTLIVVQPDFIVAMSSHITGYTWIPDGILRVGPLGWK
jgi:peptide/nickel transport system substrate-binding protein